MDPISTTLAADAVAVLAPYVKKGAETFALEIGKGAAEKAKSLLNALKTKFSGDNFAEGSLERFEKDPEKYQSTLEYALKEKLDEDKDLVAEIDKLLKDMGPNLEVILKINEAEKAIGLEAQEMSEGTAKVVMEINKVKDITGMKFGRIGK